MSGLHSGRGRRIKTPVAVEEEIVCCRCQRQAREDEFGSREGWPKDWPLDWEGHSAEAICPGCQSASWHPHCTSIVDSLGQRVDVAAMPVEEMKGLVEQCGTVDTSVSWLSDEAAPTSWRCPSCGGTDFIGVHSA